jgi:membrane fusion protein, multidrug efflux system
VNFISNMVNATSGTIELRATFANADSALVPGQLVDVVVELADLPGAIVVPREAVNTGSNGTYVYVVTPERVAESRPVKVAFDDGSNVAVVGNVHGGDQIIIDGQLRVIPNGKVTILGNRNLGRGGNAGARKGPRSGGASQQAD